MYKLIISSRGSDDLLPGFDRDRGRRHRELTNEKNKKAKCRDRIMLKKMFGFAEQQKKATYGLGYKLTLTRKNDNSVLNKDSAINIRKIKINASEWHVPHYTPSISNQAILSNRILSKTPTELQYVKRSVFMKEVNTQKLCTFELGTQERIKVPIWILVGFQQRNRQNSHNMINDTFHRPPVTNPQCIMGTEKYPDSGILLNYDDDNYSQGYGQIKEAFRALTRDDILHSFKSGHDFRSSNNNNDIGYNLCSYDLRYQKKT